jgi:ATP-binding cassette subfamily C protein CydD
VNGHNNAWSAQWLRENTSYMNQYPFLFDGTLGYNVFLKKEVNPDAGYPEFLNKILEGKSAGWHTVLTHNGKQLSGGERQLVTLARMMLFPKPIALVDEPTANLDTTTAEIIMEQLAHLAQHRLVIVASHEPKFEEIANTVLHLNWGEQMKDA